jgi:hypothetical protein
VLLFFIAGLLYLLRFERVDNLGAYSIPPETGLLIPSVITRYRADCEWQRPEGALFPAHAKAIVRQIVISFPSQCSIWMTNDGRSLPDRIAAVRVNPNLYSQTSRFEMSRRRFLSM